MRPRVFPAEDARQQVEIPSGCAGFNEAAGIPRGRRERLPVQYFSHSYASMRPRVFPAEDSRRRP